MRMYSNHREELFLGVDPRIKWKQNKSLGSGLVLKLIMFRYA